MKVNPIRKLILVMMALLLLSGCVSPSIQLSQESTPTPQPPTPTNAPTAVISEATPLPEARIKEADLALSFGDFSEAYDLFAAPPAASSNELQAAAVFGQGLAWLKQGDPFQATNTFKALLITHPDSLPAARAHFLLATIYTGQELFDQALQEYQAYLDGRPGVLDAQVYESMGDVYARLGDDQQALDSYRQAYLSPSLSGTISTALKVANLYEKLDKPDDALQIYQEMYHKSESPYTKAQIDLLMGRLLIVQNRTEEGYAAYQDAVANYPQTYDAYSALAALVEAGQVVDELQRGIINYNVGQNNLAIEALDRYLAADGASVDTALYYKALAVQAMGVEKAGLGSLERTNANALGGMPEDKQAITLWNQIITDYPESQYRLDSIQEIITTQNAYLGQLTLATNTALAFVAEQHMEAYAPGLLWTAGRYYLLDDKDELAAQTWSRIGIEFPSAEEAFNGLLFGGIIYFRLGKLQEATDDFNRATLLATVPLETAAAQLWLGKVSQAQGNVDQAQAYWQAAGQSDPGGYYALRAGELINNQPAFASPAQLNLEVNLSEELQTAVTWFRRSFNIPIGVNLEYSSALFQDSRMVRGLEYDRLGYYQSASDEFESLRNDNLNDAVDTFRLMVFFLDRGYYKSAIECSKTISILAGYEGDPISPNLPPLLAYVQYGLYYLPWVQAAAEKYDLPVLLLFSLIKQESGFEGHALSSAGASGLLQLMPATAAQIAGEIGFPPNFVTADLAVPYYSLELGANYLARQLFVFDDDIYAALAAYNGGPGSAFQWKAKAGEDPDVFLGTVQFLETRTYIRVIAEIFYKYALIYGE